jgi:hypothetical protein
MAERDAEPFWLSLKRTARHPNRVLQQAEDGRLPLAMASGHMIKHDGRIVPKPSPFGAPSFTLLEGSAYVPLFMEDGVK